MTAERSGAVSSEEAQRDFWEASGIYRPSDHPVVELFARQRVSYLTQIGALDGVHSLLDVGAGSGFSSAYYPEKVRVVACDFAHGMLRGNPITAKLRSAVHALPFRDRTFDAVTCWELLHHVDDPAGAIREMMRVARLRVMVFEPNRSNPGHLWLALSRPSERRTIRFSPGHLRRLAAHAGARIRLHVRCGLLFPNVTPLRIARLLARLPYRVPLIAISQLVILEKPDRII